MGMSSLPVYAMAKFESHTIVRFCAPNNNVYPFFISDNDNLAGINPDMLRQIFASSELSEVKLQFLRRPWKRCNADLENGEVDMMIGGYDANRRGVAYPPTLGFALEDSAISTAEVCFSSKEGKQMENARRGMQGATPFVVGIEAGFSKNHSSAIQPQWVVLFNPIEKFRMLEKGRVDAIVQVCSMDRNYPIITEAEAIGFSEFKTLFPPYLSNPAYVVFSQKFANKHTELAKRIISASREIDKDKIFRQFRPEAL